MNRQIKFRGKRKDTGKWVYGCCLITPKGIAYIFCNDDICEVVPESVGQFTGLLDALGKEIYENDFVRFEYGRIAIVLWNEEESAFCIKFTDSEKVGTRSLGRWINQIGEKIELYGQQRFCAV